MLKKTLAGILIISMLFNLASCNMFNIKSNKSDDEKSVFDEIQAILDEKKNINYEDSVKYQTIPTIIEPGSGFTQTDSVSEKNTTAVTLDGDKIITSDTVFEGIVNSKNGKAIYVRSGQLTITDTAVINCDIYLENKASLFIEGKVNGTVTVRIDQIPDSVTNESGEIIRAQTFEATDRSYIKEVVLESKFGSGWLNGTIDKMIYKEEYTGEIRPGNESYVKEIYYYSRANTWAGGHIENCYQYAGGLCMNYGHMDNVFIYNNAHFWIDGEGSVDFIYCESNGGIFLGYTDNEKGRCYASAGTVVLNNENGSIDNQGTIDNLIIYSGRADNGGYVKNAYINEKCSFSLYNESHELAIPVIYAVDNLYVKNSESISLCKNSNNSTQNPKIGYFKADGVNSIDIKNINIDKMELFGFVDSLNIENADISKVKFDHYQGWIHPGDPMLSDIPKYFNKKDHEKLLSMFSESETLLNKDNKSSASRKYDTKDLGLAVNDKNALPLSLEKSVYLKNTSDVWFKMELKAGDYIKIDFRVYNMWGVISLKSPAGFVGLALPSADTDKEGFYYVPENGIYYVKVSGAEYGADFKISKFNPVSVTLSAFTAGAFPANYKPVSNDFNKEDLSKFRFELYDETIKAPLSYLKIDGDKIILPPGSNGHIIRIDAHHFSEEWGTWGNFNGYAPGSVKFTAGTDKDIIVVCYRYGEYDGWAQDFSDAKGYIYNSEGKLTAQLSSDDGKHFYSGPLPDGEYKIVFIRDPKGVYRFIDFADFSNYGFKRNRDYVLDSFINKSGKLTQYQNLKVTDAPVFDYKYLKNESTGLYTSETFVSGGSKSTFTLLYDFSNEYKNKISNVEVMLSLSENCIPENNKLLVDGKTIDANFDNGILTAVVPVDGKRADLNFIVSGDSGQLVSNAVLSFEYNGELQKVYIGSVAVDILNISINGPSATSKSSVSLYGYSVPGKEISIYDGNKFVIAVKSRDDDGFWFAEAQLVKKTDMTHNLKAVINKGEQNEFSSNTISVNYISFAPEVNDFIMEYQIKGDTVRLKVAGKDWGKSRFHFEYGCAEDTLKFTVKLTNNEYIERMWVTSTRGVISSIEGFYDKNSDSWIAKGKFSDEENFGDFRIDYTYKNFDSAGLFEEIKNFETPKLDLNNLNPVDLILPKDAFTTITESVIDEKTGKETYKLSTDMLGDGSTIVPAELSLIQYKTEKTPEDYIKEGYINVKTEDGGYCLTYSYIDEKTGEVCFSILKFNQNISKMSAFVPQYNFSQTVFIPNQDNTIYSNTADSYSSTVTEITIKSIAETTSNILLPFINENVNTIVDKFTGQFDKVKQIYEMYLAVEKQREKIIELQTQIEITKRNIINLLPTLDPESDCPAIANNMLNQLETAMEYLRGIEATAWMEQLTFYGTGAIIGGISAPVIAAAAITGGILGGLIMGGPTMGLGSSIGVYVGAASSAAAVGFIFGLINDSINKLIDKQFVKIMDENLDLARNQYLESTKTFGRLQNCRKEEEEDPDKPEPDGSTPENPTDPTRCPSGFVFESTENNRLSGVMVKLWYQDEYGNLVLWDAESYGQKNPQITDENGTYGWFVPDGIWKVTYELEGYKSAESEWLVVPPERFNVNQSLIHISIAKENINFQNTFTSEIILPKKHLFMYSPRFSALF